METCKECLDKGLMGSPLPALADMRRSIDEKTAIFLFDFQSREIHGVFRANGTPAKDIVPGAWKISGNGRKFPAQLRVHPRGAQKLHMKANKRLDGGRMEEKVAKDLMRALKYRPAAGSNSAGRNSGFGAGAGKTQNLPQHAGYMFLCNEATRRVSLERKRFGAPLGALKTMLNIGASTAIFLHDFDAREIHGVFHANGTPRTDSAVRGLGGPRDAQLQVQPWADRRLEMKVCRNRRIAAGPMASQEVEVLIGELRRATAIATATAAATATATATAPAPAPAPATATSTTTTTTTTPVSSSDTKTTDKSAQRAGNAPPVPAPVKGRKMVRVSRARFPNADQQHELDEQRRNEECEEATRRQHHLKEVEEQRRVAHYLLEASLDKQRLQAAWNEEAQRRRFEEAQRHQAAQDDAQRSYEAQMRRLELERKNQETLWQSEVSKQLEAMSFGLGTSVSMRAPAAYPFCSMCGTYTKKKCPDCQMVLCSPSCQKTHLELCKVAALSVKSGIVSRITLCSSPWTCAKCDQLNKGLQNVCIRCVSRTRGISTKAVKQLERLEVHVEWKHELPGKTEVRARGPFVMQLEVRARGPFGGRATGGRGGGVASFNFARCDLEIQSNSDGETLHTCAGWMKLIRVLQDGRIVDLSLKNMKQDGMKQDLSLKNLKEAASGQYEVDGAEPGFYVNSSARSMLKQGDGQPVYIMRKLPQIFRLQYCSRQGAWLLTEGEETMQPILYSEMDETGYAPKGFLQPKLIGYVGRTPGTLSASQIMTPGGVTRWKVFRHTLLPCVVAEVQVTEWTVAESAAHAKQAKEQLEEKKVREKRKEDKAKQELQQQEAREKRKEDKARQELQQQETKRRHAEIREKNIAAQQAEQIALNKRRKAELAAEHEADKKYLGMKFGIGSLVRRGPQWPKYTGEEGYNLGRVVSIMPRKRNSGYDYARNSDCVPDIADLTSQDAIDGVIVVVDWSTVVLGANASPIDLTGATGAESMDQELLRMLRKDEQLSVKAALQALKKLRTEWAVLKKKEVGAALLRAREVMRVAGSEDSAVVTIQVRRLARDSFYFTVNRSVTTLEAILQECASRVTIAQQAGNKRLVFCVRDHTFIATRIQGTADIAFAIEARAEFSRAEARSSASFLAFACDALSLQNLDHIDMYTEYEFFQKTNWTQSMYDIHGPGVPSERPLADYVLAGRKSARIYFGVEVSTSDAAILRGPLAKQECLTVSGWEAHFENDRVHRREAKLAKRMREVIGHFDSAKKCGLEAWEAVRHELYHSMFGVTLSPKKFFEYLIQNQKYEDVVFLAGFEHASSPSTVSSTVSSFRCLFETTLRRAPKQISKVFAAAEGAGSGHEAATIWLDLVKAAKKIDAMANIILARPNAMAAYPVVLGSALHAFVYIVSSSISAEHPRAISALRDEKLRSRFTETVKSLLGDGAKPSAGKLTFARTIEFASRPNLEKESKKAWGQLCALLIPHLDHKLEFQTAMSRADEQTLTALFEYNPAPEPTHTPFSPSQGAYVAVRTRKSGSAEKKTEIVTRFGRVVEVDQVKRKKKKKKKKKKQGFDTAIDCRLGTGELMSVRGDGCCVVRVLEGGATAYMTGDDAQAIKAVSCRFGTGELVGLRGDGCCVVELYGGGAMAYLSEAPARISSTALAVDAAMGVAVDETADCFQILSYDKESRLQVSIKAQKTELTPDERHLIWHKSATCFALERQWVLLAELLKRLPQLSVPPTTPLGHLIGAASADQPQQYSGEYHSAAKAGVLLPYLLERGAKPRGEAFKASVMADKIDIAELLAKYHPPVAEVALTEAVRQCKTADRLKKWVKIWRKALQITEQEALPALCVGGVGIGIDGDSPLHAAVGTKCAGIVKVPMPVFICM
jgi:flagellar biosynthesis GTPase FlhF